MSGGLDPSQQFESNRTSIGSMTSASSQDSAYVSKENGSEVTTATSPYSGKGFLSSLTWKLKHKRTSLSPFEKLSEMTNVFVLSSLETKTAQPTIPEGAPSAKSKTRQVKVAQAVR